MKETTYTKDRDRWLRVRTSGAYNGLNFYVEMFEKHGRHVNGTLIERDEVERLRDDLTEWLKDTAPRYEVRSAHTDSQQPHWIVVDLKARDGSGSGFNFMQTVADFLGPHAEADAKAHAAVLEGRK